MMVDEIIVSPALLQDADWSLLPPDGHVLTLEHVNRVLFGCGALQRVADAAGELGASRVLLVSDPGVRAAGHVERTQGLLEHEGIRVRVFDQVQHNPAEQNVQLGAEFARAAPPDCIVGLGGGSAMDVAKGINFLLTNGGAMRDYWGSNTAAQPMLPSIGIPTTSGTGSEAQSYALIEQDGSRRKMACGDPKALFRWVVLDPELTASAPAGAAAQSGMDALSHAVESYVSRTADDRSRVHGLAAWSLLEGSLEASLGGDVSDEVRARMQYGAYLAGMSIELSMLGAAHACDNPLTATFDVAHGAAVLLMLPHVVRFNEPDMEARYNELMRASVSGAGEPDLASRLESLRALAGLPENLRDVGVPRSALPDLARAADQQWTARYNPRPVGEKELQELYESAY
jgi:alcohol dehydrogenase